MTKNLVAYFSRTGEQYGVGNITKGNTKILAEILAKVIGADLFEIKVVNDNYPDGYNNLVQYAKTEKQANARPEIIDKVENFEQYENIYIGTLTGGVICLCRFILFWKVMIFQARQLSISVLTKAAAV